jgi:hypothetical protein
MGTHRGHPTDLTPRQVRRILAWYARWEAFEQRHGSVRELAARLHAPVRTVYNYLAAYRGNPRSLSDAPRGRPRSLTPADIRRIIRWHDFRQRFLRSLASSAELARDLGIKEPRIFACVNRARRERQRAMSSARLPSPGSKRERESRRLSVLLRTWPKVTDQGSAARRARREVAGPTTHLQHNCTSTLRR